jgi:hypothetical protein
LSGTNVKLIEKDVRQIDFTNEFDAAVGHGSIFIIIESVEGVVVESFLTSTEDMKLVLDNIYQSLKIGGKLIWDFHAEHVPGKRFVSLPNGNRYEFEIKPINGMKEFYKLQQIIDGAGKLVAQSTDHKVRIPIEEFYNLARRVGFKKIEVRKLKNKYLVLIK